MGKQASKRFRALRKVSSKQAARLRLYRAIKSKWLLDNPICMACEKINLSVGFPLKHSRFADEVHHRFGKLGELLFWTGGFVAVCSRCHRYIHDNPAKARALELLAPVGQWNNTSLAKPFAMD